MTDQFYQDLKGKKVAVRFTASWCGPCKMISPHYDALREQYSDFIFCTVDVDKMRSLAKLEKISNVPTFKFYVDGVEDESLIVIGANVPAIRKSFDIFSKKPLKRSAKCGCGQNIIVDIPSDSDDSDLSEN